MILCVFCAHQMVETVDGLVHVSTKTWACDGVDEE
jgi:hypothetical protein